MSAPHREIRIGSALLGLNHRPFIVAEMSGNHNGSLKRALAIVDAAAAAGVQALKIQTYTADTMTLDIAEREFLITDPASPWRGESLYRLYETAHTPWAWHKPIFERARALGMMPFSSPFDLTAVDFLESLEVPCYKIASFENVDLPLIHKVASTGKPVIISTGMATAGEIGEAVTAAREAGCKDLVLLKCTSSYPADPRDSNLATLVTLRELFGCEVGISDHTLGVGAALAGIALGATVIEKHFTLSRAEGGVDAAFSLEPQELKLLVEESLSAWQAVGIVRLEPTEDERRHATFRRSLYITMDMRAGDVLGVENLRAIRPGLGLSPKYLPLLLGKKLRCQVRRGTPMSWDLLS